MASSSRFLGLNSSPPATRLRAASGFGRLVAAGLMDRAEGLVALAAGRNFCDRVRLAHALTDATLHWQRARRRAERAVRNALAGGPMGTRAAARDAAHGANRDLGYPLREVEVEALLARVLARAMAHAH